MPRRASRQPGAGDQSPRPAAAVSAASCRGHFGDLNDEARAKFEAAGFTELAYDTHEAGGLPALGVVRCHGSTPELAASKRPLFTF